MSLTTTNRTALPIRGLRMSATAAGIRYQNRLDLALMEFDPRSVAAAVFTKNKFQGAPVVAARQHFKKNCCRPRLFLINSGCANAGLGRQGIEDAEQCCGDLAHNIAGVQPQEVIPFSTGIIGEPLPVRKMADYYAQLIDNLGAQPASWNTVAQAIKTTDTQKKISSCTVNLKAGALSISGMAKGAGMICPNMATMLAFIATDLCISAADLGLLFRPLVEQTFNAISVDGDTSPNDACVLTATNAGDIQWDGLKMTERMHVLDAIGQVMQDLSCAIISDAEGRHHMVKITVEKAQSKSQARAVAYTLAHSPLVKTAINAADPNWGRIASALGRTQNANFDMERASIFIEDFLIFQNGCRYADYDEKLVAACMQKDFYELRIVLGSGFEKASILTCDLSEEYVRINNSYRS